MAPRANASLSTIARAAHDRRLTHFLAIGVLSYVIDAGLLVLITGPWHGPVWLGTTVGFWTSVVVNFALNRVVFSRGEGASSVLAQSVRYGLLLGFNYLVTLAIVTGGTSLGLPPIVPKTVAVVLTFGWNYVLYRRWIFR